MSLKNYVSVERAANIRGVEPSRIIAMINAGKLKKYEYDGGYVLKRSDIENYVPSKGGRPSKKAAKKRAVTPVTNRRSRKTARKKANA